MRRRIDSTLELLNGTLFNNDNVALFVADLQENAASVAFLRAFAEQCDGNVTVFRWFIRVMHHSLENFSSIEQLLEILLLTPACDMSDLVQPLKNRGLHFMEAPAIVTNLLSVLHSIDKKQFDELCQFVSGHISHQPDNVTLGLLANLNPSEFTYSSLAKLFTYLLQDQRNVKNVARYHLITGHLSSILSFFRYPEQRRNILDILNNLFQVLTETVAPDTDPQLLFNFLDRGAVFAPRQIVRLLRSIHKTSIDLLAHFVRVNTRHVALAPTFYVQLSQSSLFRIKPRPDISKPLLPKAFLLSSWINLVELCPNEGQLVVYLEEGDASYRAAASVDRFLDASCTLWYHLCLDVDTVTKVLLLSHSENFSPSGCQYLSTGFQCAKVPLQFQRECKREKKFSPSAWIMVKCVSSEDCKSIKVLINWLGFNV
ncbi:hypothetical protein Ciccas_003451 [Cichlidogyrus casuarinus]|uniref:FPL domain-containing protein n=1 Tax=Cichlidogyrus casuarinus TaxID=1844966 RepID=A0ABD2QES9_9PLAT